MAGWNCHLADRFAGELGEAIVDSAQHAHVAHRAVGVDDPVKDDCAAHVLPHQFQWIGGIDFARSCGRGEIG